MKTSEKWGQASLPLTSSAGGSPAKMCPALARAKALLGAARDCGLNLPGSSESCGHGGPSSRTSQAAQADGSSPSAWSWNGSAMRRYRSRCRRAMLALHTEEGGCLSWPTPAASEDKRSLLDAANRQGGPTLSRAVGQWPTPAATAYGTNHGGAAGRTGPVRPSLDTLAKQWPTPTAGDSKASGAAGYSTASGRHTGTTLTDATVGPRGPLTRQGGSGGRVLNPRFVEALMGMPDGWTDVDG
jgi:hypothetical protein